MTFLSMIMDLLTTLYRFSNLVMHLIIQHIDKVIRGGYSWTNVKGNYRDWETIKKIVKYMNLNIKEISEVQE